MSCFQSEDELVIRSTSKPKYRPLSAVHYCWFTIFVAAHHTWRPPSLSATRQCAMPLWQAPTITDTVVYYCVNVIVKFKNKVVPVDRMKIRRWSGDIAPLILKVGIRLMSVVNFTPRPLLPRKIIPHLLSGRPCEPHSRAGCFGEEKNFFPLQSNETRTIQRVAYSLNLLHLKFLIRCEILFGILMDMSLTLNVFFS